jgi:hypothetical protein
VRALLGDRVTEVSVRRQTARIDRFATPEEFRDFFKANYGPTVTVYRSIAGDPERVAALDDDLAALAARNVTAGVMQWEYLLVTARRR